MKEHYISYSQGGDHYYVGDWDGDGKDNIAVRRGATFYFDINFDGLSDAMQTYGNGDLMIDGKVDKYIIGDWDGDGRDNIGVVRGAGIFLETNFDGTADIVFGYGNGAAEDEYLVGKWNGGKKDHIAVRRGGGVLMDFNNDGASDMTTGYGNGNSEKYLVGDWNGSGTDHLAVRRGAQILMNYDFNGTQDFIQTYGNGDLNINGVVDTYIVGDWDGDGRDNLAVIRGNTIFMDTNFDGLSDKIQIYGNGMSMPSDGSSIFSWMGDLCDGLFRGLVSLTKAISDQDVYKNQPKVAPPANYSKCGDESYDPKIWVCCYCPSSLKHQKCQRWNEQSEAANCEDFYRLECK